MQVGAFGQKLHKSLMVVDTYGSEKVCTYFRGF
jgi:hypothetical protein